MIRLDLTREEYDLLHNLIFSPALSVPSPLVEVMSSVKAKLRTIDSGLQTSKKIGYQDGEPDAKALRNAVRKLASAEGRGRR